MKRNNTLIFILITVLIWVLYDIYLEVCLGNQATESANIWHYSYLLPSIPFSVGVLIGHLFIQLRPPSPDSVPSPKNWSYVQIGTLGIGIFWLAIDIGVYFKTGLNCAFSHWIWDHTWHMPIIPLIVGAAVGTAIFQMHDPTE